MLPMFPSGVPAVTPLNAMSRLREQPDYFSFALYYINFLDIFPHHLFAFL